MTTDTPLEDAARLRVLVVDVDDEVASTGALDAPVIVMLAPDGVPLEEVGQLGMTELLPKRLLSPERLSRVLRVRDAERKARVAHAELERQARRLERLVEASPRIHAALSLEHTLELVVREAREILGAEEAVVRWTGAGGEPQVFVSPADCSLRLQDTTPALSARLFDRDEKLAGLLGVSKPTEGAFQASDSAILHQLAHLTSVALENARLYRVAQDATQTRDDVLAIVSHDLRNPLNTISMSASLLKPGLEGRKEDASLVARIERGATRMSRIIEDLLDATRIESGRLPSSLAKVRGVLLVKEAIEAAASGADAAGVTLSVFAVDEDLAVLVDRHRILRVLSNLLGNGLKLTPRGGGVRVSLTREGGFAAFSVADDGPGIPPQALPHLFKRYWKGQSSSQDGAGLGLYIARGIVEAHGGAIRVEPTSEAGATLTFTLPLAS